MPTTNSRIDIRPAGLSHVNADIHVSTSADAGRLGQVATLNVHTGACNVQTYLCPSECRALAKALTAAAMRLELAIDAAQVPA